MNAFEKNILSLYGERGKRWLNGLSQEVCELEKLWGLHSLSPLSNLSYSYVLSGYQQENPIILKLSPDVDSLDREARALVTFSAHGAVSLLQRRQNALLLARALPGQPLKGQKDAIEIACRVIERLQQAPLPQGHRFPQIEEWLAVLDKEWALPPECLQRARRFKQQLLRTQIRRVLLHGDLHQDNILLHGEEWVVIDPKGVIGFPINEIWASVEKPEDDLAYIAHYFGYPLDEVVKWYYIHLILAACWQVEDNLDPSLFIRLAQSVLPKIKDDS